MRLGGYVAATPEFTECPKVADAASELLLDVFGGEIVSSRLVLGVASLPLGSPVELGKLSWKLSPDLTGDECQAFCGRKFIVEFLLDIQSPMFFFCGAMGAFCVRRSCRTPDVCACLQG